MRTYIGRHLIDLFEHLLPEWSREEHDQLVIEYRAIYLARGHKNTRLYPGVAEMIGVLPGRKSTATTKGTPTAGLILEQFGLRPYFDHVQGTDSFPSKPEPDVILRAVDALGALPEDCLMVGDSGPDMEAGRCADVRCAVGLWNPRRNGALPPRLLDRPAR